MGVETELFGLKNRGDGKEFRVIERADGSIAVLAGEKVLVDSGVTPVTARSSGPGLEIQDGSATRSFVTAEMSGGVPTGNFFVAEPGGEIPVDLGGDGGAAGPTDLAGLVSLAASKPSVRISSAIAVNANATVPRGAIVSFVPPGKLVIAAGVTLTWDASIDAGPYQIFEFADDSADLVATQPNGWEMTQYRGVVCPEWFGAVGDARFGGGTLAVDSIPLGTDSTRAIQRACRFAQSAAPKHMDLLSNSGVLLEFQTNAQYLVAGNNILGCHTEDLPSILNSKWIKYSVRGNNCTFYWRPINADDAFVDKCRHFDKPDFESFTMRAVGFSGVKGIFCRDLQQGADYSAFQMPVFRRLQIDGGVTGRAAGTPGLNNGLQAVFDWRETSSIYGKRVDDVHIEDCRFWQFRTFMYVDALEAVGIRVTGGQSYSNIDGAVWVDWKSGSSRTVKFAGFTMLMKGPNQTMARSRQVRSGGDTFTPGIDGEFFFDLCRIETAADGTAFTLVDADCGRFHIRGLNAANGATLGVSDNSCSAKLERSASVHFVDCAGLPNKVLMGAPSPEGGADPAYTPGNDARPMFFADRCNTKDGRAFDPRWHRFGVDEALTLGGIIAQNRWVRPFIVQASLQEAIRLKNVQYSITNYGMPVQQFRTYVAVMGGTSARYLSLAASRAQVYLPPYVVIRSLRVVAGATSAADTMRIKIGVAPLVFDVALSTSARTNTEVVTGAGKSGIVINVDPATLLAEYQITVTPRLAGADVSSATIQGWLEIVYEGICDGGLHGTKTIPELV